MPLLDLADSAIWRTSPTRSIIATVAPELVCVECRGRADPEARGWHAHLVESDHDQDEDEVVFFCPACAAREFGDMRRRPLDPPAR